MLKNSQAREKTRKIIVFLSVFAVLTGIFYYYDVSLFEYDSFVHFLDHILFVPIAAWFYLTLKESFAGKQNERMKFDAIIIGGLLAIMAGIFWEILQNTADNVFGTTMFFDPDQAIDLDVKTDIASDLLGALVGTIILYFQKEKWLAEIKKLPENS